MRRTLALFAGGMVLLSTLLLTGCPGPKTDPVKPGVEQPGEQQKPSAPKKTTQNPGDYFPLTEGSTWEYEGEGNEFASFDREVLFVKGNRAQVRENNGGTVSAAVYETSDQAVTRIFFEGEVYDPINLLDHQPTENVVVLKPPLVIGTKWGESPTGMREIVAVDATVDTPAEEFKDCIKVKIAWENSTVFEYFKEGVGMVKREFIDKETDTRVTSSLKKFDVK